MDMMYNFYYVEVLYVMYDVFMEKSAIWNLRLKDLIKTNGYSQESFADALNKKYDTKFTQRVISRWTRVGSKENKRNGTKLIGFPDFDNMLRLSDFFTVDIGYLIGETDEDTFTLEKACAYLGLSGNAVKAITEIDEPFGKYRDVWNNKKAALDVFLSAAGFNNFFDSLFDLYQSSLPPYGMDKRKSICLDYVIDFIRDTEFQGKIRRYNLNEAFVLLADEICPKPSGDKLPKEYGECNFCQTASHEDMESGSFICPLKAK